MSEKSDASALSNIYEEDLNEETALDLSSKDLESLPDIQNKFLCVSCVHIWFLCIGLFIYCFQKPARILNL